MNLRGLSRLDREWRDRRISKVQLGGKQAQNNLLVIPRPLTRAGGDPHTGIKAQGSSSRIRI